MQQWSLRGGWGKAVKYWALIRKPQDSDRIEISFGWSNSEICIRGGQYRGNNGAVWRLRYSTPTLIRWFYITRRLTVASLKRMPDGKYRGSEYTIRLHKPISLTRHVPRA